MTYTTPRQSTPSELPQAEADPEKPNTPDPAEADKVDSEAEKWKALARKHEAQAKANAEAARKLAELEEGSKTEQQKMLDRAAAAEKRAEDAELLVMRLEVASEKGLSPSQAKRLVGSTREDLDLDADELLAAFKQDEPPGPSVTRQPVANLRGGGDPTQEPLETDPAKLAESVSRGF
jgi:hypothetical protein